MLRFLADENLNNGIVRGIRRRVPSVSIVRIQDVGMTGMDDSAVLDWAAANQLIVLTHDVCTMTRYATERVAAGMSMPGLIEISRKSSLSVVIEDVILIAECGTDGEFEGQVIYLPLQ